VGGGAAGLMAAGQAAETGAAVLLLEKMPRLGLKLRITGKGRCNLTNVAPMDQFIAHFNPAGQFLRQAFYRFFTDDLVAFFERLGVSTSIERGGRIFPTSNQARDIVEALTDWIERLGVEVQLQTAVKGLLVQDGCVTGVMRGTGEIDDADAVVLATGGASYPGTGSAGDGYRIAEQAGHTIVPIRPALVPVETAGPTASRLQGLSLRNVSVSLWIDGAKKTSEFGEMLFTHFGLSGPIILTLSRAMVDALHQECEVIVAIDLKPALDEDQLDARLLRELDANGKRQAQTVMGELLPRRLVPICLEQARVSADTVAHQITAEERGWLRCWLKDFRLQVTGHRSFDEAIITAGGIDTREVAPRTMASRLVEGLYFAGEILDVDADTGGYNLQAAFSTGYIAGRAAAAPET
jgi:predicted Rossmann fold flavoprotein